MAKCPGVPRREFEDALKKHGYKFDRAKGGHEIWEKRITKSIAIPSHGSEINGCMARRLDKECNLGLFRGGKKDGT